MNLTKMLLLVLLALGLLLLPGPATADKIQQSTDEKGTIQIGNPPAAGQENVGKEKACEEKAEGKAQPMMAVPEGRGLNPPKSRRPYGPEAEARRQAFEKAHPNLIQAAPAPPAEPLQK
jgi:hypothetical protein